ncbi:MAG: bifunctional methylenetetrahydrofolate dehydrogenase/methenyltetrahydrofolate cyclohydrolase FolD ['Candidatus Kapabacteria' thiocyanatum]|uniref:Bifunctional protein FolD n=1 Tax=Candidatus Kapaibacterium thiocyanatum TaxID=1895771 RepID=A0A1M3L699_9BACT|nr:bifunctional methylenetetrahydrofolate dehydrogenase/methenyltetrahydrofolate cyclohydrolase FolD ['Candidatus Kapabacteria' thiocyanatum]OJX61097.1 MAG: bifunctional 5,10-methylene-tetrahydrofolate dehydrogenase/5,10-methylene-tetrahydrofolate cyclohydrolase ['Candidatus Kapabacteria' thiocyanatum]
MAVRIDGKAIAATIREEIRIDVERMRAERGRVPGLNLLLVGDDPASQVYVRNKGKACEEVGIRSLIDRRPSDITEEEVLDIVRNWNADPDVDGILVQLPLPKHIDEHKVIETIDPDKDVDGFHPVSAGRLMIGLPGFVSCTPAGILELLKRSGVETSGRHVVVVGRSNIVGKPIAMLLAQKRTGNATVTLCHTGTQDLASYTKQADILIAAVGVTHLVKADMVKPGVVIVDVGMNRIERPDGTSRLTGDVDFEAVEPIAGAITPVPGGVGPMTIAMLLKNTLTAARGVRGE